MTYIRFMVTLLALASLTGCSKSPVSPAPQPTGRLSISPTDGQTAVRLDAAVILTLSAPVDRDVVERNFHLVSESALANSLCPDPSMPPHGSMSSIMGDPVLMRHIDQYHSTHGTFSWNGPGTECAFRPDFMMTPLTPYMIHMGGEMMSMMSQRLGDLGKMGGHGAGQMSNDMMFHFTTLDTTGGGHGGHH